MMMDLGATTIGVPVSRFCEDPDVMARGNVATWERLGQDIVFLGERGQAKTRMARLLVGLLDEEMPALAGCEISDEPYAPIYLESAILAADPSEALSDVAPRDGAPPADDDDDHDD